MPTVSTPETGLTVAAQSTLQLLVFSLAGEEYAIELTQAREIITTPAMTPVPSSSIAVRGILNLRGRVVTVIDLVELLKLKSVVPARHVIIAEQGRELFGVLVDGVTEVLRTPATQLKPTPDILKAKVESSFVRGVVVIGAGSQPADTQPAPVGAGSERLILVLDMAAMLGSFVASHS